MEIWVAKGHRKELKKAHPFLRDYGILDVEEIAHSLGYDSSAELDEHSSFVLNDEIKKRLEAFSGSRRFYRILFLVREIREGLAEDLLNFSTESQLKYEAIYVRIDDNFRLICKSY
jgi:hypothetical protein